ncbi:BON domain-containing protein [bacterium]|nr:BON domain-containing protein [bacterium]
MSFKKYVCFSLICCFLLSGLIANSFTNYMKDSAITSKVKFALIRDKKVSGFKIKVSTIDKVVYLKGTVLASDEAVIAEKLAREISDVKDVISTIKVEKPKKKKSSNYFQKIVVDSSITGRIKSAFLLNQNINGMKIKVTTKLGVVYLEGFADSKRQRSFAEEIVKKTYGVKGVKNFIKISR